MAGDGGVLLIWLYNQPGFLNFDVFDVNLRTLFQMPLADGQGGVVNPLNLSVAVWVGFLALFGIASDNGVVMATYLDQTFARHVDGSGELRESILKVLGLDRAMNRYRTAGRHQARLSDVDLMARAVRGSICLHRAQSATLRGTAVGE